MRIVAKIDCVGSHILKRKIVVLVVVVFLLTMTILTQEGRVETLYYVGEVSEVNAEKKKMNIYTVTSFHFRFVFFV